MILATPRLRLVAATVEHARAEIADRAAFAALLQAVVPADWPPETLAEALPLFLAWLEADPDAVGWYGWYGIADGVLVASGGFLGRPRDGDVEVGYSVLPAFQGRGYATELVGELVRWALGQPGVARVVARTEWANPASVRVLRKLGFVETGPGDEPGSLRFERTVRR